MIRRKYQNIFFLMIPLFSDARASFAFLLPRLTKRSVSMSSLWYVFGFCNMNLLANMPSGGFLHSQLSAAAGWGLGGPILVVLGTKHGVETILRLISLQHMFCENNRTIMCAHLLQAKPKAIVSEKRSIQIQMPRHQPRKMRLKIKHNTNGKRKQNAENNGSCQKFRQVEVLEYRRNQKSRDDTENSRLIYPVCFAQLV